MSAKTFDVVAVALPNAEINDSPNAQIINATLGYGLQASSVIRTLSNRNPNHQNNIDGLLYVPDINASSNVCSDNELALVPSNVTTLASFPPENYPFVALAPWTSPACVEAYLSSMRSTDVVGAIFYQNNTLADIPPPVSDPSWSLNDNGRWRSQNQFPVYALPGIIGADLMSTLALYSGNMSSAPFGSELVKIYDSSDLVRLYTRMDVSGGANLPSLWVFLVGILAALIFVVLVSLLAARLIQRRQRIHLARRVANGEVDLETLGIRRLKVPQELLDKMPCYIFGSKSDAAVPVNEPPQGHFAQLTCPICLDDFVCEETSVRQLPCKHIFHPECIDPFLRDNSSLCPLCKKSALPPGYCPVPITNVIVRRERVARRMRERAAAAAAGLPPRHSVLVLAVRRRLRSLRMPFTSEPAPAPASAATATATATAAESAHRRHANSTELGGITSSASSTSMEHPQVPAEIIAQGTSARRAWLRERLARRREQEYAQAAEEAGVVDETRPFWRRVAGRFNSRWD